MLMGGGKLHDLKLVDIFNEMGESTNHNSNLTDLTRQNQVNH